MRTAWAHQVQSNARRLWMANNKTTVFRNKWIKFLDAMTPVPRHFLQQDEVYYS
jgi:hypothetical protein